jgi:hypothetical protein
MCWNKAYQRVKKGRKIVSCFVLIRLLLGVIFMYMLVGSKDNEVFSAFQKTGITMSAWLQPAKSRKSLVFPKGVETYWWDDVVSADIPTVHSPDLDPCLAKQVREKAYPYFIRMLDRTRYQRRLPRFSWLDVINRMEIMIHFFYGVIERNNIRYIISANFPHEGAHIILCILAQEMGITNVYITQSPFPNAYWILRDFEDFGFFRTGLPKSQYSIAIDRTPQRPFYMGKAYMKRLSQEGFLRNALFVVSTSLRIAIKAVPAVVGLRKRTFKKSIYKLKERLELRRMRNPSNYDDPVVGERYVYFPLHLQPEMTTDTLGGVYADQLLAVEEMLRRLPENVYIYVKENPKQTQYAREESFFNRLKAIPRVKYLPIHTNSFDLIRDSEAVATITGTAGWEALQMGKPVICFGNAWYRSLPGVFEWSNHLDYRKISSFHFSADFLQEQVNQLSCFLREGIADPNYAVLQPDFDARANAKLVCQGVIEFIEDLEVEKKALLSHGAEDENFQGRQASSNNQQEKCL